MNSNMDPPKHKRHHRHGSKRHSRKSEVTMTMLMEELDDGPVGGETATVERPHSPRPTSPSHHHHHQIQGKSVKMRTASKDFPLGAFAAKDELPKKSNRESVRASITHGAQKPTKNKTRQSTAEGESDGGEEVAELADLAELGRIDKPATKSPPGGQRGDGSRRGGRKPPEDNNKYGGLGTIADHAPISFNLDRDSGKLLPDQDLSLGKEADSYRDSLRYSFDRDSLLNLPEGFFSVSGRDSTANRPSLFGMGVLESPPPGSLQQQKPKVGTSVLEGTAPLPTYDTMNEQKKQEQDIAAFASMALGQYEDRGSGITVESTQPQPSPAIPVEEETRKVDDAPSKDWDAPWDDDLYEEYFDGTPKSLYGRIMACLDPTPCLMSDVKMDENGVPYFDDWMGWGLAGFVRTCFYNPLSPEFTALQQFDWAVVIGILAGFYTAGWKFLIEACVDFVWETTPEFLLRHGVFTEQGGSFPLYHYMWICPAILGGIISYCFAVLPNKIPDQNEWINNIHNRGVQDYRTFWLLFVLATAGMASGLSLGPELPLVLTAGMAGSWLGIQCNQSVLQARVMNLTAASAAVGGFFGFPMAGALFVLEIPHRMGLQYFEALSPATISSIVAVLTNRLVTGNDVTGYYKYPFLTATLPSEIFSSAIVFGLFGALVGVWYVKGVKKLKGLVHDWFHKPHNHDDHESAFEHKTQETSHEVAGLGCGEKKPLLGHNKQQNNITDNKQKVGLFTRWKNRLHCVIPNEVYRSAVAGSLAGAIVGVIGMFVPHVMFWGEAQLQTLIDRGATPLPVFGFGDEPTAGLTSLAYCIVDHTNPKESKDIGIGCSFLISAMKIVVTGLSLGTGIIGGHFWGPLFVGCSASHFLVDSVRWFSAKCGFGGRLAAYPCVAILCTMGSTHVVTFRAHTAIMLILTLTISAFNPQEGDDNDVSVAGDYSAVFPLLVVAVFVSLMISRPTVFYPTQRSRGDIMAVPEVLCEPGMEGRPMVIVHEGSTDDGYSNSDYSESAMDVGASSSVGDEDISAQVAPIILTQSDIEKEFRERAILSGIDSRPLSSPPPASPAVSGSQKDFREKVAMAGVPPLRASGSSFSSASGTPPIPKPDSFSSASRRKEAGGGSVFESSPDPQTELKLSSSRLDELLNRPINDKPEHVPPSRTANNRRRHRRIQSAPIGKDERHEMDKRFGVDKSTTTAATSKGSSNGATKPQHRRTNSGNLVRIASYGEVKFHQPSLLDQARVRAASAAEEYLHRRVNSASERPGGHSRQNSGSSVPGGGGGNNGSRSSPRVHSRKNSDSGVFGGSSSLPPARGHRRKNSEPLAVNASTSVTPSKGRHARKSSDPFGGTLPRRTPPRGVYNSPATPRGGGALPLDDIEQAFDSLLKSGGVGL